MRRHLLLVLGVCGLLLTPGAAGGPMVPGDPTPPVVTPHFFGTQGLNGWWVSNVTLNWTVEDPESQILETRGCDAVTLTTDTVGTSFTCYARSDGGETTVTVTIRRRRNRPCGHRHAVPLARFERLVQPRALGQLQRHRRNLGNGFVRRRRRATRARTTRTPRSPALARTGPGT